MAQNSLSDIVTNISGKVSLKADKTEILAKASVAEAEGGTDDSKVMTPKSTKAAILKLAPKQDIKLDVLDIFYPVGTIYQSSDANFNPNEKWGGTWVKIENRFLLASGSRGVGAQGGEENVVLNINQIPSHNHDMGSINVTGHWTQDRAAVNFGFGFSGALSGSKYSGAGWSMAQGSNGGTGGHNFYLNASGGRSGTTGWVGGTGSHNNMPPYETINIWKRTA